MYQLQKNREYMTDAQNTTRNDHNFIRWFSKLDEYFMGSLKTWLRMDGKTIIIDNRMQSGQKNWS